MCDKITQTKHDWNVEMLLIIETFKESDEEELNLDNNDHEATVKSKEWFDTINRGGLTRCTNEFYNFVVNIEIEIKRKLQLNISCKNINAAEIVDLLKTTENVIKSWNDLMKSSIENNDIKNNLLNQLLLFYVRFRLFANTNKTMELYKSQRKKTVQKSKSLRSKLVRSEP